MLRAITHVHTNHSYDSALRVRTLLRLLSAHDVDLALINDHDTFAGSLAARAEVQRLELSIRVPVAAEIRTEFGDVIVVFPSEDVAPVSELKKWERLQALVRADAGVIWLPHPYSGHEELEMLAAGADVIEVFNSRLRPEANARGAELCTRHNKSKAYGADVHLRREACWFVEYPSIDDDLEALRGSAFGPAPVSTLRDNIVLSRLIAGFKRRDLTTIKSAVSRYLDGHSPRRFTPWR